MAAQSGRGGLRPGAGRKPKRSDAKQRNRVVVLLTDKELRKLEQGASEEPLGTFARSVLLRSLARRRK